MPKLSVGVLFCACVIFNGSANAFDLNGAWTADDRNCAKVFIKRTDKMIMTRNSDVFGGGFVVEGNEIRGLARTCKIIGRKQEGNILNLIVSCATDIALLDAQPIAAKIEGEDRLTRIFPSFPEAGTTYYRCKF